MWVDVDKDGEDIYKAMDKKKKDVLSETAEYLLIDITGDLKESIVRKVILKLNNSLLELCRKCSTYYATQINAESLVACACGQEAHSACYKDIRETLASFPGVVYQCSSCSNSTKPVTKVRKTAVAGASPTPAPDITNQILQPDNVKSLTVKVVDSFNLEILQARYPQPSYPVCEKYKRLNCPHGRNGQTEIDGEQCKKLHPKKCFRWCKAGKDETRGCTNGDNCMFYHPILCRNSVRYKKCLNSDCTFTHLQYTKRYDNNRQQDRNRSYNRSEDPSSVRQEHQRIYASTNHAYGQSYPSCAPTSDVPGPWESGDRRNTSSRTTNDMSQVVNSSRTNNDMSQVDQSFLANLLQSKTLEMQTEMQEFKKSIILHLSQMQQMWQQNSLMFNPQQTLQQPCHPSRQVQPQQMMMQPVLIQSGQDHQT